MGVLAISEKLYGYKGPECVVKGPQEQGMTLLVLNLATRGTSYKAQKVKNGRFGYF